MTKNIKIQLYGKVEGYLTLTQDSDFPFTLALADIKDLSKRKSTTSKSIEIGGTDENNRLLGYYFDVNLDPNELSFNINKIQKCCIFVNDDMFMDNCIMQLTDISKVQPNSQREYSIKYTINIQSNQADFFANIKNKNLEDIELTTVDIPGNAGGGFIFNSTFIKNSFNNTYADGYKFLFQKTTYGKITLPMFKPATYVWTYWNRIIKDAGFRYTFDEIGVTNSVLTDPSRDDLSFRNLLLPFTNKAEGTTMNNVVNYAAQAVKTGGAVTINGLSSGVNNGLFAYPTSLPSSDPIIANTLEINDPSGSYTPTQYTAQFTGTLTVNISQRYAAYINNFNAFDIFTLTGPNTGYAKISVRNRIFKNGVDTGIESRVGNVTIMPTPHTWTQSARTLIGIEAITTPLTVSVVAGDVITVRTGLSIEEGTGNKRHRMVDGTPTVVGNFRPEIDIQSMALTYSVSIPNAGLSYGGIIDMNNFIPQKVKQVDFFKSILNMHNIYVYADKYDENLLHFTTRDNYYDTGVKKNFTQKFCKDMEHSDQFLSEISNKELYMSYKQDKYIDNEDYFNEYNKTYGSATFIFDNEYVKDEDKLEIIFSPSPINMDGDKFVTDLSTQDSLRILLDSGEVGCNNYQVVNYAGNEVTFNTYPVTTHYDDPNVPTYDINFGTAQGYYHNYTSLTNNNLINKYWRRTLHQINKSRLFTCYLYLTEVDIRNISLNDIIYIENAYYYINKIIDFNPVKSYKTKVELISIDDLQNTASGLITNWGDTKPSEPWVPTPVGGTVRPTVYGNIIKNPAILGNAGSVGGTIGIGNSVDASSTVIGDYSVADGKGSTVVGNNTFVFGNLTKSFGDNNQLYGNNIQNSGVDNVVTSNNVISNGDNNVLDSPGVYLGSNITSPANLGNVLVVGDNITPTSGGVWTDELNGVPTSSFITPTLAQVLINGNTTGANNIIMSGSTNIGSGITNNITFNSGINLTATSITVVGAYSIPVVDGTAGQVLTTNGAGVASWASPGGLSARLTAWDAYNANGIVVQTSSTTWANRTITTPNAGLTTTNGNGVSGNPSIVLSDDMAAIESLAGTGYAVRTGTNTWANRTITGTASQITVTNGNGVSGNTVIALDSTFLANNSLWRPGSTGTNTIRTQSGFNDATGTSAIAIGGSTGQVNTASGNMSAVLGGFSMTVSGTAGFSLGGSLGSSSSNYGGLIGGIANTNNSGSQSVIVGGGNHTMNLAADNSVILGGDVHFINSSHSLTGAGSNHTVSSSSQNSVILGGTYGMTRGGNGNVVIGGDKAAWTNVTYASGKSSFVSQGNNSNSVPALGIMSLGSAWSQILGGNDNYIGVNGNATANSTYNATIIGSQGCGIYQSAPGDTSLMIHTGIYGGNNSYIRSLALASNLRTCNIIGSENSNITNNTGAQIIGNIILGGAGHTLTNCNNATVLGGNSHSATAVASTLQYGTATVVTEFGERASGIGQLSSLNNQEGTLQLSIVTTNNTLTNLTTGASLQGINIPTNTAYLFDISTMATITSATNRGSTRTWSGRILVKNIAGAVSAVVVTAYNASTGDTGATTFTSSVANFSGTRFLVQGTGTAGTTVSWHCRLNYQKIQFA